MEMGNLMNASLKALLNEQYKLVAELREENRKLKEYNGELIENHKKDIDVLCEENKKLNIKVASLEGEIKGLNSTIERLHKEIEELEKPHPKFSDFGGYDEDEHIVKDENTYRDLDL